jgi:NitT/TauT family transport system permease protein
VGDADARFAAPPGLTGEGTMNGKLGLLLSRTLFALALLAIWEYGARRFGFDFYISQPTAIFARLLKWIGDGTLFFHMSVTVMETLIGFVGGALAGIAVGLALGRAGRVAAVINPFMMGFYSMPKIALAPVFVLWFGIDMKMKIVFVGMIVFFLVFLNTYTGVRNVSREQIAILRLMGAKEYHLTTKVILPSAIVWVFAGLRLSVPYALIGAIIGEMMATNRGLGFLLANTASTFDSAGTFATLIAIIALSMTLNGIVHWGERRLMPWQTVQELQEATI